MAIRASAVLALLACFSACKKDEATKAGEPASAEERRDQAANLTAPKSLFENIPADTPYVMASFEPIPRSYWARVEPMIKGALEQLPPMNGTDPAEKFAAAAMRDLRANLSEAGIKQLLGIGADGRFAFYGVGIVPVMRLELADSKALLASVEKWQKESGMALPTATAGGKSYWRFGDNDVTVVLAVLDDQLIASAGPTAMVDKGLPFILGVEKPKPNMADGGELKKVAAQHGFAGYGVGYVDAKNLLKLLVMAEFFGRAGGGQAIAPACMEQLTAMAGRVPRLAWGYDELSDKKVAARLVLQTEASLTERLKQLTVEVPGLSAGHPADRPVFAVGIGMNLEKARLLIGDAVEAIGALASACGGDDVAQGMQKAQTVMAAPLPPGVDKVRGALVSVLGGDMGPDGTPIGIEAYAIVASDDPAALVATLKQQAPGQIPDLPSDGKFHPVVPAGAAPGLGEVSAAIKEKALLAAVGARGTEGVEKAMARTGPSPLFMVSYDYGQIMQKFSKMMGSPTDPTEKMVLSMFSVISMWAYPTDHGLALAMSADLGPAVP
jgi:hypothetical protein